MRSIKVLIINFDNSLHKYTQIGSFSNKSTNNLITNTNSVKKANLYKIQPKYRDVPESI